MNVLVQGVALAAATLISEDAATVAAGGLVALGSMAESSAVAWVALGIWLGDLGLFAIGRCARRVPGLMRWVDRRWPPEKRQSIEGRLARGAALAVLGSRFLPGTRVLLYVTAGALRVGVTTFAISAAIAAIAWTSVVVSAVSSVGGLW